VSTRIHDLGWMGSIPVIVKLTEERDTLRAQLAAARAEAEALRRALEGVLPLAVNEVRSTGGVNWGPIIAARRALGPGGENDGPSK